MFSIALAFAQPLLMGVPSAAINGYSLARYETACFAFAVSYSARGESHKGRRSARGKSHKRRRAVITDVVRFPVRSPGTCHREEHEIRLQLDHALNRRGSVHSRTDYTAAVVYTYSHASTAHRRRAQVIERIEPGWRVVRFQFAYLPTVAHRDPSRRWRNGRPGLERARVIGARLPPVTRLPARVDPWARVRIVRRGGG